MSIIFIIFITFCPNLMVNCPFLYLSSSWCNMDYYCCNINCIFYCLLILVIKKVRNSTTKGLLVTSWSLIVCKAVIKVGYMATFKNLKYETYLVFFNTFLFHVLFYSLMSSVYNVEKRKCGRCGKESKAFLLVVLL